MQFFSKNITLRYPCLCENSTQKNVYENLSKWNENNAPKQYISLKTIDNRKSPYYKWKKKKHFCYVFTLHVCPYDMAIDIMNKKSAVVVINSSIKTTKPYFWQKWNNVILLITWKIYRKMVLKKKGRIVLFHGLVYLYTLSFTPHNWTFLEKIKY